MHVCCIGKVNIPVFTCRISFPFNSNKGKTEGGKKKCTPLLLTRMQLRLKPHRLVETSTQRRDVSLIACVCWFYIPACLFVVLCSFNAVRGVLIMHVWEIPWCFYVCFWWILSQQFTLVSAIISHNTWVTFPSAPPGVILFHSERGGQPVSHLAIWISTG